MQYCPRGARDSWVREPLTRTLAPAPVKRLRRGGGRWVRKRSGGLGRGRAEGGQEAAGMSGDALGPRMAAEHGCSHSQVNESQVRLTPLVWGTALGEPLLSERCCSRSFSSKWEKR